jgi:hypothetical protein
MNRPFVPARKCISVAILFTFFAAAEVGIAAAGAAASRTAVSPTSVTVRRAGGPVRAAFDVAVSGEGLLDISASAPGVWWGTTGAESAVVEISVDGRYQSDVVIPAAYPIRRTVALGSLTRGPHLLRMTFSPRSPSGADTARLSSMSVRVVSPGDADYLALSHAPILYGRDLKKDGGPFENAVTDTPLVAWHEATAASTPGDILLEYSVVWSNEDGGTSPPALMARWGRTTDIEWIYRVELRPSGVIVPGSAVFQGKNHATKPFRGTTEGRHPLLETCTSNNNVCDSKIEDPMRFALDTEQTRAQLRARERLMDKNQWTYPIMAAEMAREGQVESPPHPSTAALGDQRTYLYLECRKTTADPNDKSHWVGVSIGVVLKADPMKVFRSDHRMPDWSIQRDLPAATTIELPAGTTSADIARILAIRVAVGKDTGASVTITNINRGFFLNRLYLPKPSFVSWSGSVTLTPQSPRATLWSA